MDFVSKNFRYVTMAFGEFIEAVEAGNRLYLRSLSAEKPSELPADLDRDFPSLSNDFRLPQELNLVRESAHSSALRISGPVNMWLHYDVGSSRNSPNFSSNLRTGNG
jgi:tRNA wybutosine-synthesizing protein 4